MQNLTGFKVKRQYERVLEKLKPPPGVPNGQFRGVMTLLYILASHYPRACPGQRTLAMKAMVTERTIQRWTANAVEWGWLEVVPDAGVRSKWSLSYTNLYIVTPISALQHDDKLASSHADKLSSRHDDRMSSKHRSTSYSHENKNPSGENTSCSPPTEGLAFGQTTVEPMDKSRAEQIAAAAGDRRIERRPRQKEFNPSRLLANYFLDEWEGLCQEEPRLREFRPADSVGQMVGYFRSTFLAPVAGRVYTPDEVRAYIDLFIDAVHRSEVQVKAKQTAFMRFTGWWGRSPEKKRDPDVARRYFEENILTKQKRAD